MHLAHYLLLVFTLRVCKYNFNYTLLKADEVELSPDFKDKVQLELSPNSQFSSYFNSK